MKIKKRIAILILFSLLLPLSGLAFELQPPTKHQSFEELISAVINFLFNVALILAPLMIILGGFYFLTSGGDPEKVKRGKNIILFSVIGLLIMLLAKGFIEFIMGIMKVN